MVFPVQAHKKNQVREYLEGMGAAWTPDLELKCKAVWNQGARTAVCKEPLDDASVDVLAKEGIQAAQQWLEFLGRVPKPGANIGVEAAPIDMKECRSRHALALVCSFMPFHSVTNPAWSSAFNV